MSELPESYEKVSIYPLDDDVREKLFSTQIECVFNWATRDGWPMGVIMSMLWHDGRVWLTARIRGPENPSQNEEIGLLVDGFDTPPYFLMGHAQPYYGERLEALGYQGCQDMLAYLSPPDFELPERFAAATVVGFVGSFQKFHGVDLLSRMALQVARERPESCFLFVGDGPGLDRLFGAGGSVGPCVFRVGGDLEILEAAGPDTLRPGRRDQISSRAGLFQRRYHRLLR